MYKQVGTLVIKGSRWLRHTGNIGKVKHMLTGIPTYEPTMRNPNTGRHCCLGLLGEQCGLSHASLETSTVPSTLKRGEGSESDVYAFSEWMTDEREFGDEDDHTWECVEDLAININDEKGSDREKIRQLREVFAMIDVDIDWRPDE